jgi:hypothetical protein
MEGQSTCLNCGTALTGRWCPVCGQDGERRLHSLPTLLARTLESVVNFDGRVASTLRRLIAQPGRLTHEYAQGRFVGQVDPVRHYLATSALYFFLAPRIGGGLARLIIPGRSRYVEEFFVFSVHYQIVFFLVVGGTGVLAALMVRAGVPWLAPPLLLAGLVILFIHLRRALRVAFSLQGARLLLATGALFLLHFGGAQLLQNLM